MDGVLVDAPEWHYEALNDALALFGYTITREEHDTIYNGLSTRVKLQALTHDKGLLSSLHQFINEMKQIYTIKHIEQKCHIDKSKQIMMQILKGNGFKVVVCANCVRLTLDIMLKRAGLFEYPDFTFSNEDVKLTKPHPEIYLTAMKKLGLLPSECLIIEDAEHGIQSALAALGPDNASNLIRVENAQEVSINLFKERLNIKEVLNA